jgi:hypothetical protein
MSKTSSLRHDGNSVILSVTHKCGHISAYGYASAEFALADIDRLEHKVCHGCHNANELAKNNSKLA